MFKLRRFTELTEDGDPVTPLAMKKSVMRSIDAVSMAPSGRKGVGAMTMTPEAEEVSFISYS